MNNICKLILNFHKESLLGTDSLNTVGLKGQHCDILSCVFVCVCVCGWVCVCVKLVVNQFTSFHETWYERCGPVTPP